MIRIEIGTFQMSVLSQNQNIGHGIKVSAKGRGAAFWEAQYNCLSHEAHPCRAG
jgi:hypothetical protein